MHGQTWLLSIADDSVVPWWPWGHQMYPDECPAAQLSPASRETWWGATPRRQAVMIRGARFRLRSDGSAARVRGEAHLDMGVERAGEQPRPSAGGRPGARGGAEGGDRLLVVGQPRQQLPARQHVPHPAAHQTLTCQDVPGTQLGSSVRITPSTSPGSGRSSGQGEVAQVCFGSQVRRHGVKGLHLRAGSRQHSQPDLCAARSGQEGAAGQEGDRLHRRAMFQGGRALQQSHTRRCFGGQVQRGLGFWG